MLKRWLRYRWVKISLGVAGGLVVAVIVVMTVAVISFKRHHAGDRIQYGVSFSIKYANELGVDWQQNFLGLINDLGVRRFRLMSYWDLIEPARGQFDFKDLDWQFRQAEAHGAKISLAVGLRQPRYPECHWPDWARGLDTAAQHQELLKFEQAVVEHYRGSPALEDYQLENEVSNNAFGVCPAYDKGFLATEYGQIKSLDPAHPVDINVGNQSGVPLSGPIGDEVGMSVYLVAFNQWPLHNYYNYPVPPLWHTLRAAFIEYFWHRTVFVHELQGEPWGNVSTKYLSDAEQAKTMTAAKLVKTVDFADAIGTDKIYLWGGEWWYWRKTQRGDDSLWVTAKGIFARRDLVK